MTNSIKACVLGLALIAFSFPRALLADDVADEADLQFTLGAEAYQKGDLKGALEHFLASNRLAPNRNVLYNVARVYDGMKKYPEAYRYYSQALEGETNQAARTTIEAAMKQLAQSVVVVHVETSPPGATLYIDRKDLGPRGSAPRSFGLAAGRYRIIAELAGHEPAEAEVPDAKVGEERRVSLTLRPILGTLAVGGQAMTALRIGSVDAPPRCTLPCEISLPPGTYSAFATAPGFRPTELKVTISPSKRTSVEAVLEPLVGTLVVNTDEPRALIEVDGKPSGFTPAILTLASGRHRIELSLAGFRKVSRDVDVTPSSEAQLDVALTLSEEVVAASRVDESVEDAPASVTVIPRLELAALAYPTIAEAVRGAPGVYVWDDRSYVTVGVRGLGRLGSYGNRIVVLYDGQPVNDNWIGSSYVGYDALTDLGDVQRIEVVRGPGSVLYGTNAFSGVVNLVSDKKRPDAFSVGVGTNQNGVARVRVRRDVSLGRDGGFWTTVGGARSSGRDFEFADLGAEAKNADGFESAGVRGGAHYRWFNAQWSFNTHDKRMPTGAFETLIGDRRNRQSDSRGFVELRAEPQITDFLQSLTRVHGNLYRFKGAYVRDPADGGIEYDRFRGTWVGLEQRMIITPADAVRVTVGGEGQLHVQVKQTARDDAGPYLDDSSPFQVGAAYLNADLDVSSKVKVSAGARLDAYSTFGTSVSPRGAVILRPYADGNLKILGGKAFRAPSAYELYYNDDGFTQIASPNIQPELVYSAEIEHTHRFTPTVAGNINLYGNYVKDLILTAGAGDDTDPLHYVNSDTPLATVGGELGIRREWRRGWMVSASYGFSHARFLKSESLGDVLSLKKNPERRQVANAPAHLASLKGAVPIISRQLLAATRVSVEGPRYDRYETVGEDPQGHTSPVVIWDLVLSGSEARFGLNYALGVYNAFDWRYSLPVSPEFAQRAIAQDGRTFLASAEVAF
jgi:outer membrane receptor protein involved in Fe transport